MGHETTDQDLARLSICIRAPREAQSWCGSTGLILRSGNTLLPVCDRSHRTPAHQGPSLICPTVFIEYFYSMPGTELESLGQPRQIKPLLSQSF